MQVMVKTIQPCTHIFEQLSDPHGKPQELFQSFARATFGWQQLSTKVQQFGSFGIWNSDYTNLKVELPTSPYQGMIQFAFLPRDWYLSDDCKSTNHASGDWHQLGCLDHQEVVDEKKACMRQET